MKLTIKILLAGLALHSHYLSAGHSECLDTAVYESNELYNTGGGCCQDGVYQAVSTSMLAWGVGLFVGICLLTGLVHNSRGTTMPADDPTMPLQ